MPVFCLRVRRHRTVIHDESEVGTRTRKIRNPAVQLEFFRGNLGDLKNFGLNRQRGASSQARDVRRHDISNLRLPCASCDAHQRHPDSAADDCPRTTGGRAHTDDARSTISIERFGVRREFVRALWRSRRRSRIRRRIGRLRSRRLRPGFLRERNTLTSN